MSGAWNGERHGRHLRTASRPAMPCSLEGRSSQVDVSRPEAPGGETALAAETAGPTEAAARSEVDPDDGAAAVGGVDGAKGADQAYAEEAPRRRARRVGWPLRVVASVALALLAVSWLLPYFAQRSENAALAAASDGDVATALGDVRRAAAWDPLAVSPLLTEAALLQQLGRNRDALEGCRPK